MTKDPSIVSVSTGDLSDMHLALVYLAVSYQVENEPITPDLTAVRMFWSSLCNEMARELGRRGAFVGESS